MPLGKGWLRMFPFAVLAIACHSPEGRALSPLAVLAEPDEVYRPDWTAGIQVHAAEIRACLRGRQAPALVVHVQALPVSGATGVTDVDGFGAVEHCSAQGSRVLLRQPAKLRPEHFAGLPAFVLGVARPAVGPGVPLEEIVDEQELVGWLYWPSFTTESGQ